MTIQMKAIEQYFHAVLFVFDNHVKRNSRFFPSVLNLALLGVKGLLSRSDQYQTSPSNINTLSNSYKNKENHQLGNTLSIALHGSPCVYLTWVRPKFHLALVIHNNE